MRPTAKKQKTVDVIREEDGKGCDTKVVDSEIRKIEEDGVEKEVGDGEMVQQDAELVTNRLSGTGEKMEEEERAELSNKSEEAAAGDNMEVSEKEKKQEQVDEKMSTPKSGGKTGATPGSGKKKAMPPFFSE